MSWWVKWISLTNPLQPLSAWPRLQHQEVSLRSLFPPGEMICNVFRFFTLTQQSPFTDTCHSTSHMSLPYRFLFILLGPQGKAKSYNEIGRAIATLMVDDVSVWQNVSMTCLLYQMAHADTDSVSLHMWGQNVSFTVLELKLKCK